MQKGGTHNVGDDYERYHAWLHDVWCAPRAVRVNWILRECVFVCVRRKERALEPVLVRSGARMAIVSFVREMKGDRQLSGTESK